MKYPLIRMFGLNLCKLRNLRNLNQEQLADLMEIKPRQLQRIEAGDTDPGFINILGFHAALTFPPHELLHGLTMDISEWKRLKVKVERP